MFINIEDIMRFANDKSNKKVPEALADKARFLVAWESLSKIVELETKGWADELKTNGSAYSFKDLGSLQIKTGREKNHIDNNIVDDLSKKEIKAVATFSEKALKEAGMENLIAKYKVIDGKVAPSISITLFK
jgi:hypothetical protein